MDSFYLLRLVVCLFVYATYDILLLFVFSSLLFIPDVNRQPCVPYPPYPQPPICLHRFWGAFPVRLCFSLSFPFVFSSGYDVVPVVIFHLSLCMMSHHPIVTRYHGNHCLSLPHCVHTTDELVQEKERLKGMTDEVERVMQELVEF